MFKKKEKAVIALSYYVLNFKNDFYYSLYKYNIVRYNFKNDFYYSLYKYDIVRFNNWRIVTF